MFSIRIVGVREELVAEAALGHWGEIRRLGWRLNPGAQEVQALIGIYTKLLLLSKAALTFIMKRKGQKGSSATISCSDLSIDSAEPPQ